jgi:uncharacterized UPF0160 family protein
MNYSKNSKMKTVKLVTHNGSFHTDDIFAAATLSLMLKAKGESVEITRTRDTDIINAGDYVFDVGGVYDAEKNRFDHHQVGGAGHRENTIEYSSFGLIWKKFGAELCGSKEAAHAIDKRLVAPVDAVDNGMDLVERKYDVFPYTIQDFFRVMRPMWNETETNIDDVFIDCVEIAKNVLVREMKYAVDSVSSNKAISSIYENTQDKRILIFDKNYPSSEVLNDLTEVIFVVYPRDTYNYWGVKAVRADSKNFNNRKDFPAAWGGLKDEALQKVTSVPDAVFCHRGLFLVVSKSKEGAIKLAQIALQS